MFTTSEGYDPKACDMWSLGICLYTFLLEEMPFFSATLKIFHVPSLPRGRPGSFCPHHQGAGPPKSALYNYYNYYSYYWAQYNYYYYIELRASSLCRSSGSLDACSPSRTSWRPSPQPSPLSSTPSPSFSSWRQYVRFVRKSPTCACNLDRLYAKIASERERGREEEGGRRADSGGECATGEEGGWKSEKARRCVQAPV